MKTIILLCTLLLTACSSIPLATKIHFSDAKPEDFFSVDPRGILVKVSINSAVIFDPVHSINLSASIKDSTGERTIAFPLEVVDKTTQAAVNRFFNNRAAINVYLLKLGPRAIENLDVLRRERMSGINKRVGLTAAVNFSKEPNNDTEVVESTVLSVALKLSEQDEFITLIDNWKVEVSNDES